MGCTKCEAPLTSNGGYGARCQAPVCPTGYGTGYEILTSGTCKHRITSQEECFLAHKWLGNDNENATARRRLITVKPLRGCVRYDWGGASDTDAHNLASHRNDNSCGKDGQNCICRTYECKKCPANTIGVGGRDPCRGQVPAPFGPSSSSQSSGSTGPFGYSAGSGGEGPTGPYGYSAGSGGEGYSQPFGYSAGSGGEGAGWMEGPSGGAVSSGSASSSPFIWYASTPAVHCKPGYGRQNDAKINPYDGSRVHTPSCQPCSPGYFSKGGVNPKCSMCPIGTTSPTGATECIDLASLQKALTDSRKFLCEAATDFCGPGTKWIDGSCVSTFDGITEACKKSRPGWEWTCEPRESCSQH